MTDEERKSWAKRLILSHAKDVEYLSIFEVIEYETGESVLPDADASAIGSLIADAKVEVSW